MIQTQPKNPRSKNLRRRRIGLAIIGLLLPIVAPLGAFQVASYRQNAVTTRTEFPPAPPIAPTDRILVISPHCDDETLGAGGTIAAARARGIPVRVVFMTNGDGSLSTQLVEDARQPRQLLSRHSSILRMAKMRQRESLEALQKLGVPESEVIFLGYPDGGTRAMWEKNWTPSTPYRSNYTGTSSSPYDNSPTPHAVYCGQQALEDVTHIMREWRPTVVLTAHSSDTHSDHYATYAYTGAALETLRLQPDARHSWESVRLMTFLIHHGVWPVPHGYHPDSPLAPPAALKNIGTQWTYAPLSDTARQAKNAALECYTSQLAFTPHYLRSFVRRNELFGLVPVLAQGDQEANWNETYPDEPYAGEASLPPLLNDGIGATPVQELWPRADIKNVTLAESSAMQGQQTHLTLRLTTARSVSRRLTYQMMLHVVTAQDSRPYRLELRYIGRHWQTTLSDVASRSESHWQTTAKTAPAGLEVRLPREALRLAPAQPATLLVSASSLLGTRTLDRSSLGTLRLSPEPQKSRFHQTALLSMRRIEKTRH